jgi:hypothetical protein
MRSVLGAGCIMENSTWGHCKHCRFFGSPALQPMGAEEANCEHPILGRYGLRIYGSNGCRGFELRAGLPENVEPHHESVRPSAPLPA